MKRELIFGIVGAAVGTLAGFTVGYKILEKKVKKESEEKLDREVKQLHNYDIQAAEKKEKDSAPASEEKYEQMVADHDYQVEKEQSEDYPMEDEDNTDILEESDDDDIEVTKYVPKKHRKPKILGKQNYDEDDPIGNDWDSVVLLYYMKNDILMDEESGHYVDEEDTIGPGLRRMGFMNGQGNLDETWVRSYDHETNYLVKRKNSYAPSPDTDSEEEQNE